ncbi:MAG TPA: TonB-dependent receptor [Bryobacteraceae bacterium]|nr:TonB-dependent receptor [Bryobacteraceae bacterium]
MKALVNLRRAFVTVAALAVCSFAAFGQTVDANVVGTVTDASGSVVANAKVTATNKGTNVPYETNSNSAGDYRLNNVPVGKYDIAVTATGFSPKTEAGVQLDLNHTSQVNFSLAVGSVTTAVEVTEAPALIETSSSQLQTTYDSTVAVDVAVTGISRTINGAGIYNLSLLGAGVASSGGVGQGTGPSIAGQRPENNYFAIDGVVNNAPVTTGPNVYVSNEATQELNIAQNQFSAEFGGASGGVFNLVVKTGTNAIHGSIFAYSQNRDMNAVDYSEVVAGNRSNTRFDNNRIGAGIGGPIIKNKLFYYGNFEYNPLGQASVPGNPVDAPTAAGISLLNGISGLSKNNLGAFEKYVPVAGAANGDTTLVNGVSIPLGPLTFASPNFNNSYHAVVAVDYNLSSKDQLRGRYIYDKSSGLDAIANLPAFFEPNPTTNNSGSFTEFHNFSPTLENELRVSYTRSNAQITAGNFAFPGLSVFPNISLDDLGLQLGPDPNTPTGSIGNTSSASDNLTKTWGKHTFKGGYQLIDNIVSGFFIQRSRGDYDYASLGEFLADQQPSGSAFGTPNSGERSVGSAGGIPLGNLEHSAFFQDDWRFRSNLTFNIGIRYEYVTVPLGTRAQQLSSIADVPGVISFTNPPPSKNEWSPRLGFAWSPGTDGKTSIRGGVARSFDNTYLNLNENAAPPFYQTTQDVNPAAPVSNFLQNGGLAGLGTGATTAAAARAAISSYTFPQNRPYALTGTLGVQRLLGKDYTLEARYVYTKGVHLWNQTRLNIAEPVNASNALPTYFSAPTAAQLAQNTTTLGQLQSIIVPGGTAALPYNNLATYGFNNALVGYNPWGNSRYNGLAIQLNKRYSNNFSYIAAYTWSHAQDDSTATNFSTIMSPRRVLDFLDMRREWADSALDRRHRLTITPVYDFKPFQKGNWLMKNVIGNWNIAGTYTFQSPEYATVQDGLDANLNSDATGDRAVINPAGNANVGTDVVGLTATGAQVPAGTSCGSGACKNIVAYLALNPNARYVTAGLGAYDSGGRNTLPMGRTNNIDAALKKRIAINERMSLDFGAQFFNLFNHSQFTGGYLSDVTPYSTAAISAAVFQPRSSSFGQINNFFPSNSRQLNLVAHFTF